MPTFTWRVGGETVVENWESPQAIPHVVRYDSTRFPDGTVVWSDASGTAGMLGQVKPWRWVEVAVVYNRHGVRSSTDFELGELVTLQNGKKVRKFGLMAHESIRDSLHAMNHLEIGQSVPYDRNQLIYDAKRATAQHLSAHGSDKAVKGDDGLKITAPAISEARNERRHGVPGFNVVFFASCSTAKNSIPPLASAYGIQDGAVDRVYGGYNGVVYIAGSKDSANVFWAKIREGYTAAETKEDAELAYDEELARIMHVVPGSSTT
jgi:hypothetical protein